MIPLGDYSVIPLGGDLQSKSNLELRYTQSGYFFTQYAYESELSTLLGKKITPGFRRGFVLLCGEGGIRTPGTQIEYASLANWWIKPLSHLSGVYLILLCSFQSTTKVYK